MMVMMVIMLLFLIMGIVAGLVKMLVIKINLTGILLYSKNWTRSLNCITQLCKVHIIYSFCQKKTTIKHIKLLAQIHIAGKARIQILVFLTPKYLFFPIYYLLH